MRVVIVGAVAGGMSAATRLRRISAQDEIVVLERGDEVSYANCGLPYHLSGSIPERSDLILQTPQRLHERFRLDVRTNSEVLSIDATARSVTVQGPTGQYQLSYDRLVLSPGAAAFVPRLPGIERALTLRTVADVDRITALLQQRKPRSAAVIGGGFIGLETAENLREAGLDVTIVELDQQVLAPLDPEMAQQVHQELRRNGVELVLGCGLAKVHPETVELADGRIVPADLVVLAIGVRPETELARKAGLTIGSRGGILVDDQLRTSDEFIYAVGDAVEKRDHLDGQPTLIPLANLANRQGRLVADSIAGRKVDFGSRIGTAIVKVFDLTIAVTGWNEKRLRASGRAYQAVHTHPANHAGYYPGAEQMSLKLLFDPETGTILGGQGVGGSGVDKRIDVLATAIRGNLRAEDLADLELAYAPPYGSAKDPINMLGYVAENLRSGTASSIQWHELPAALEAGAHLVDVRTEAEFAAGHLPEAVNLPLDELRERVSELPTGDLIIYCQVGQRAHTATMLLTGLGHTCVNLDGGYRTWSSTVTAAQ